MEPEGSSWVEKALELLVSMVGLAAGARAEQEVGFAAVSGSVVCCSKDSALCC